MECQSFSQLNTQKKHFLNFLNFVFFTLGTIWSSLTHAKIDWVARSNELPGQIKIEKKFIDIHAHVGCEGIGGSGCRVGEGLRKIPFKMIGIKKLFEVKPKDDFEFFPLVSDLVAKSTCTEAITLLALDNYYEGNENQTKINEAKTEFYVPNKFVADEVKKNFKKNRNLLWGASVNPLRNDWKSEIDFADANGAVLIKLIPSIMGFLPDGSNNPWHAKRLDQYYKYLAVKKIPLLIHLDDEGTFGKAEDGKDHKGVGTFRIRFALDRGVTVIVAHTSSRGFSFNAERRIDEDNFVQLLNLMKEEKYKGQLYADTSALPSNDTRPKDLCKIVDQLDTLGDRLVWGSDFPLNHWLMTSLARSRLSIFGWKSIICGKLALPGTKFNASTSLVENTERWDRHILLQHETGIPEKVFESTKQLLLKMGRIKIDSFGKVIPLFER